MTDPAERLAEAAAPRRAAEQAVLRTAIVLWEYEWTGSKPGGGWEAAYVAHMDAIGRYAHEVHTQVTDPAEQQEQS